MKIRFLISQSLEYFPQIWMTVLPVHVLMVELALT